MKKAKARRRRIPAFGEWNDDHGGYGYGDGDWPVTQYFESATAMQAGLVVALPPSPKPVKKVVEWTQWSDSGTPEVKLGKQQHKVVVGLGEQQGKQSRVADAGAHAAANYQARRVVKAVDEDLYEVAPDMLCHKPRKRLTRSLWLGCLGLNHIA